MTNDPKPPTSVARYHSAEAWVARDIPPRPKRETPEIAIDRTPVTVRGEALQDVWWRGRQWAVTTFGIEALDGTYVIKADRLADNMAEHPWPTHMAGKRWCDVDEFATAWMIALLLHGHAVAAEPASLRATFARLPLRDVIPRWQR